MIYWLAMVPNQMAFRLLLLGWMSAATVFFFHTVRRFFPQSLAIAASVLFVIFTSLPSFEGNIPNGELFVIGFTVLSLWLLTFETKLKKTSGYLAVAAGVASGLGILTKVPAVLDTFAIVAFLGLIWLAQSKKNPEILRKILLFSTGVALTILASILYFAARGSLADYFEFGLLYNLRYSQAWQLPFDNLALSQLFTLPGKLLIFSSISAFVTILVSLKKISPMSGWVVIWLVATLFASLLSNRPYPHYLLQIAPPLALSLSLFFHGKENGLSRILLTAGWLLIIGALLLLQFRPYPLMQYYYRYWNYSVGKISRETYVDSFDFLAAQNRVLAPIIASGSLPNDRIFIWGTNPMLYAQTMRVPSTRFTVSFHIHDFKAYEQTMEEIRQTKPLFIVVMKKEPPLAGLDEYINDNYFFVESTADMVLYRRFNAKSQLLLQ